MGVYQQSEASYEAFHKIVFRKYSERSKNQGLIQELKQQSNQSAAQ